MNLGAIAIDTLLAVLLTSEVSLPSQFQVLFKGTARSGTAHTVMFYVILNTHKTQVKY